MSKVVCMTPEQYTVFLSGTKFFDAAANTRAFDARQTHSLASTARVHHCGLCDRIQADRWQA
ncbi:MAG: aliphatic sulfonates family transporter, periplasmic ligand-binding protein [Polaromonas sp.]|nr:aliphatic sulfonates family transporter, periplasmic ligand-binding protein [Polaromonas sp.]